ncbi:hypothetical protein [Antarctobacter jejuensis]|uniref:hypothetical protein n=1 Tax=Antarctobacter jejuensis TaxID=1439938 RepID=UPI003FD3C219
MDDHLVEDEQVQRIAARAELYLHIARRLVVDAFGPEASQDHVLTIAQVASMMATLETAEIAAASQDKLTELLERD